MKEGLTCCYWDIHSHLPKWCCVSNERNINKKIPKHLGLLKGRPLLVAHYTYDVTLDGYVGFLLPLGVIGLGPTSDACTQTHSHVKDNKSTRRSSNPHEPSHMACCLCERPFTLSPTLGSPWNAIACYTNHAPHIYLKFEGSFFFSWNHIAVRRIHPIRSRLGTSLPIKFDVAVIFKPLTF